MTEPTICVVIPAFNAERYLAEALGSVLAQSRPAEEVLVVDDCSTDDTVRIARRMGAKVISHPVNRGTYAALNTGIRASGADLIAHQAADDVWYPEHLAHVAGLLDRHPRADVAFAAVRHVGSRSGVWCARTLPDGVPADAFWPSFDRTVVPHITAVIRRNLWQAVGGYEEGRRAAMDFDFWLRCSRITPFVASHRVTAEYRAHESQISSRPLAQLESVYWSRFRLLESLERNGELPLLREARRRLRERWLADMREAAWHHDRARGRVLLAAGRTIPGISGPQRQLWWWRLRAPESVRRAGRRMRGLLAGRPGPASTAAANAGRETGH